MRAVDTNLLVRLLVRDDPRQAESAQKFIAKGAWVSHLVLAETVWVMEASYDRSPEQIAAAIERLLTHAELTIQDSDIVEAALEIFRDRPALGFSDCLIVEIARKAGHLPVGTFDRQLAKCDGVQRL
jgi:predicted nucleic-acid-binding protein